ncbi:MAG: recombinase family protein [Chloroflexota bacterium]
MRAALYTRVSSQEQAQHGVSLAEQKERLEAWAKMEGWEVANIFTDEGYTGGTDNRPDLQRLMHDAKAGLFNIVAVTKIDRFFRNARLLLDYVHELEQVGVNFVAQAEGIDTSKPGMGKILLSMLGSVAEWERERIGDRIRDFRSHLARKGQWSSGRTPFGYRFNKQTKELIPDPLEVEAIRFIFDTYTEGQLGIVRTAEICNQKQIITPRAGRRQHDTWTQSAVRHVLTHPAYKGGPNDQWPFKCPAIVQEHLWETAQRQLASNRHFREVEGHDPFTGLLRCGLCGKTLRIGYNHSTKKVWECPGRLKVTHLDGSPRCTLPRLEAPQLTDKIIREITEVFSNPESLKKYIEDTLKNLRKEKEALERRLRPIQSNISRTQEKMKRADAMFEMGRLSTEDYKARITGLRRQVREYEQQTSDADPMLLQRVKDNESALQWYEKLPDKAQDYNKSISKLFGTDDFSKLPEYVSRYALMDYFYEATTRMNTPKGVHGLVFDPIAGIANYLQKFGLYAYIYPDKIEIKGAIRQSNVTADYRSARCRRFQ